MYNKSRNNIIFIEYNTRENKMNKNKRYGLSVSFSEEENKMVEELKRKPYYLNMSEFIREAIREYYNKVKNEKKQ